MKQNIKPINEMSTEELEKYLEKKKKEEKTKRDRERAKYEKGKDTTIDDLYEEALEVSRSLDRLKNKVHVVMTNQAKELEKYGGIRSNSKGGFTIQHTDGNRKISRRRDTDPQWDERADKAVGLIKDFLMSEGFKKTAGKVRPILMGFIERNADGDLEYAKVMELMKYESTFNDPRWVNGLQLLKEGYSISFKRFAYEFKEKNKYGVWNRLKMNFSDF